MRAALIRSGLGVGLAKGISLILAFAVTVVLARSLGPAGFGQYTFVVAVITLLSLPIGPGLFQLVTRETASLQGSEEWGLLNGLRLRMLQTIFAYVVLAAIIIGGLSIQQATWTPTDRWSLILFGLFILPFAGFVALYTGTLRGLGNVVAAQIPELIIRPTLLVIIVLALLFYQILSPATAISAQVMATAATFLVAVVLLRSKRPKQSIGASPEYATKSWMIALLPFTLLSVATTLNSHLGVLLLGWLGTESEVAAFRIADRGSLLVVLSLTVVNMVIAPQVTKAYRTKDLEYLQKLSTQSSRVALIFAFPIAIPMVFFGEIVVDIVFGRGYVETAVAPLAILTFGQLINVGFGSVALFLTMSGHERDTLYGQLAGLTVNVVVALLLIPSYGALGAAWATGLGLITWNSLLARKVVRRLGLRPSAF